MDPTSVSKDVASAEPEAGLRQAGRYGALHAPIVLLLGFFLFVELRSIDFGRHWDERTQVENVQRSLQTDNLLPQSDGGLKGLPADGDRGFYGYPSMLHVLGLLSLAPQALGGHSHEVLVSFVGTLQFLLNLRRVCATLCSLALLWVYLAVFSICGSRFAALFGASTLAVSWEFQYHSRWIAADAICAQFAALVALLAVCALRSHRVREYLTRAAVVAGLAASTKYTSGALVVIPLATFISTGAVRIRSLGCAKSVLRLVLAFGLAFLLITPGAVLQPRHFLWWIEYSRVMYSTGFGCYTVPMHLDYALRLLTYFALVAWSSVPVLSALLASAAILGIVALCTSFRRYALPVLLFPAVFFLFLCTQRVLIIRNVLPVLPFLSIAAGLGLFWFQTLVHRKGMRAAVACVMMLPLLYNFGWTLRASESIVSRDRPGWRPADRLLRFVTAHPQYEYRFSPGVRQLLAAEAPGLLTRKANEQTALGKEFYAMNPREDTWAGGWANNPFLFSEDFGPFDVNLGYYPTWGGSDHIALLTRSAVARNGIRVFLDDEHIRQESANQRDQKIQKEIQKVQGAPVKVEAYLGSSTTASGAAPAARNIEVLKGDPYQWAVAYTGAPTSLGGGFYGWQEMLFRVQSLGPGRDRELGITWWDFDGGGRSESIQIENSDGSHVVPLLEAYKLPVYFNPQTKTGRHELPVTLRFKIPKEVCADGSFRVRITRTAGTNAVISEIWVASQNQ